MPLQPSGLVSRRKGEPFLAKCVLKICEQKCFHFFRQLSNEVDEVSNGCQIICAIMVLSERITKRQSLSISTFCFPKEKTLRFASKHFSLVRKSAVFTKLGTVLDDLGHFETIWDKILCYNGTVKIGESAGSSSSGDFSLLGNQGGGDFHVICHLPRASGTVPSPAQAHRLVSSDKTAPIHPFFLLS